MADDATSLIAERYARALFSLGGEQARLDALAGDLAVIGAWGKDAEVARFLRTPLISRVRKAAALDTLLERAGADGLTRQFMHQVATGGRLAALSLICNRFAQMLAESRGEVAVTLESARPLAVDQVKALESAIAKAYEGTPRMTQRTNASLLAGFVLRIGDFRMDYSLAGKLTRLHAALRAEVRG